MSGKGKDKKKVKDPNKPKRPLSSFILFSNDRRKLTKEQFPLWSITEIASNLGIQWRLLEDSERSKYEAQASELKEKYDKEMLNYNKKQLDNKYVVPYIEPIKKRKKNLRVM